MVGDDEDGEGREAVWKVPERDTTSRPPGSVTECRTDVMCVCVRLSVLTGRWQMLMCEIMADVNVCV